ncbi:MAG: hypothetical protein OXI87_04830 [Albidovulum sp.]|nr:hypothetical protein [Albidovulum sp.]
MARSGGSRRPRQSDLWRAVSTTYYALFHHICRNNADLLIGGKSEDRSYLAWRQAYRSVNHGRARKACENRTMMSRFPTEIEDFANEFVQAQIKRHDADYDPLASYTRSEVLAEIDTAEAVIGSFRNASLKDSRAFAAWISLTNRSR